MDTVSWVLNAYNIMFAVLLVSMGRLADQFGRRRFFLIGMTIFTVGSLLCALSWSIERADRVPRRAGGRRRHPGAARAGDHGARVPARAARPRPRADGGGRQRSPRRSARRSEECWSSSPAGLGRGLALDLPDQRADRGRSASRSRCGSCPRRATRTRARRRLVGDGRRSARRSSASPSGSWRANDWGWGSPLIVALFARRGRLHAPRSRSRSATAATRCSRRRSSATASSWAPARACCCSAIGMMGALFMTVLPFVNLWGYSELKAALAITPVAVMAMLVSPLVGRLSEPGAAAGVRRPGTARHGGRLCSHSRTLPAEPSFWGAAWRLALLGVGRRRDLPGRDDRLDGIDPRPGAGTRLGHREHGPPGGVRDRDRAVRGGVHRRDRQRAPPGARAHRRARPPPSRQRRARSCARRRATLTAGRSSSEASWCCSGSRSPSRCGAGRPTCTAAPRSPPRSRRLRPVGSG